MKIDINKVHADLNAARQEILELNTRLNTLAENESALVAFINMVDTYQTETEPSPVSKESEATFNSRSQKLPIYKHREGRKQLKVAIPWQLRRIAGQRFLTHMILPTETDEDIATIYQGFQARITAWARSSGVALASSNMRYVLSKEVKARRLIIAQAVSAAFQAGDIISARDVFQKLGSVPWKTENRKPVHAVSNILMWERLPDGILRHVAPGTYEVRSDAQEIIARRLAESSVTADD